MNLMFATVLVVLQTVVLGNVLSHLHRGPISPQASPVHIHGSVVVDKADGIGSSEDFKRVQWSAQLLSDVVFWYELDKDGCELADCSSNSVTLRGAKLNQTDYAVGTVFVIGEDDWGSRCPHVILDPEIDPEDQIYFYAVQSAPVTAVDGSIKLHVKRITGADVIPEVRMRVGTSDGVPAPDAKLGETEIYRGAAMTTAVRTDLLLQTTERFGKTHKIADGAHFRWYINVNLQTQELRWVRKKIIFWKVTIGVEFDERFAVSGGAKLWAKKPVKFSKRFDVLKRTAIPGFGFSGSLPLIGRYSAGASVRVIAILKFKAKARFEVSKHAQYEKRFRVRVVPFKVTVKQLSARAPSVTGRMEFHSEASGFAGLRPELFLGVTARGKTLAGIDAGVSIGIELEAEVEFDPHFRPYYGAGYRIGKCYTCHHLRAYLDGVIKDAKLRAKLFGKTVYSTTLPLHFDRRIAALCAWKIEHKCY